MELETSRSLESRVKCGSTRPVKLERGEAYSPRVVRAQDSCLKSACALLEAPIGLLPVHLVPI